MKKYQHRMKKIGQINSDFGPVKFVHPNHDNSSHLVVHEDLEAGGSVRGEGHFVRDGKLMFSHQLAERVTWDVSFDGTKLAIACSGEHHGRTDSEVYINGELAYTLPHNVIYRISWLDNDRLACHAWDDQEALKDLDVSDSDDQVEAVNTESRPQRLRWFYIDGEDKSDEFCFQNYHTAIGRSSMAVREGDQVYHLDDAGNRSESEETVLLDNGEFSFDHHNDSRRWKNRTPEDWREIAEGKVPDPLPLDADATGMKLSDCRVHLKG